MDEVPGKAKTLIEGRVYGGESCKAMEEESEDYTRNRESPRVH